MRDCHCVPHSLRHEFFRTVRGLSRDPCAITKWLSCLPLPDFNGLRDHFKSAEPRSIVRNSLKKPISHSGDSFGKRHYRIKIEQLMSQSDVGKTMPDVVHAMTPRNSRLHMLTPHRMSQKRRR